jgi:hypothetical protein
VTNDNDTFSGFSKGSAIEFRYFQWLTGLVSKKEPDQANWIYEKLDNTVFYWTIRYDENRAADGIFLREVFSNNHLLLKTNKSATLLEVIIGICKRMQSILSDETEEELSIYFWDLMKNLGLIDTLKKGKRKFIIESTIIITTFLSRNYNSNGEGGLFPLNSASDDQRDVELWYQMMGYLEENYIV